MKTPDQQTAEMLRSAAETKELSDKVDAIDKRVTVIEFKVSKSL